MSGESLLLIKLPKLSVLVAALLIPEMESVMHPGQGLVYLTYDFHAFMQGTIHALHLEGPLDTFATLSEHTPILGGVLHYLQSATDPVKHYQNALLDMQHRGDMLMTDPQYVHPQNEAENLRWLLKHHPGLESMTDEQFRAVQKAGGWTDKLKQSHLLIPDHKTGGFRVIDNIPPAEAKDFPVIQ